MDCTVRWVLAFLYLLGVLDDIVELKQVEPAQFTDLSLTRHKRQHTDDRLYCTLPPHPKNGRWVLLNGEAKEGEQIPVNSLVRFHCKKGYKLSSRSPYVVCDKNWSLRKIPKCLKLCPAMHSTSTTILNCVDKTEAEIGCHEATEGSFLSYTCAPFYEAPFGYKTTFFCSDGDWTSPNPVCQPICGKKVNDDTTPLIFGGKVEEVIEYPWITALFQRENEQYKNICGGSILSQRLVLTAAHCVTNSYGDALPAEDYVVAAGKLHIMYKDSRDTQAQYLNVSHIIVHSGYKGDSRRYLGDIAVLVTKEQFVLNKLVQPVCFNDLKNINLQVGTIGVVAGFGVKEGGEPSEELRTLEIPYKSEATCAKELPGDWGDRYNVIDKLCAGHYNKSMSTCKGDSGNGLFFRNSENKRYYVHGVVSLGHSKKGQCNVQTNSLYTKVAFHYDFIDREVTKYYVKECSLPAYPENGKWITEKGDKEPGDTVPSNTILLISCNDGYKLSSDTTRIKCESSFIMPTCQRLCPEIHLPPVFDFSCKSKEGETVSCNEATEGATLTFRCPDGYEIPDGSKNTRKCLNGAWESPAPTCRAIEVSTEHTEEQKPSAKVVCVYDSKKSDSDVKPESLNASLCTHVIYDFVGLSPDGNLRVKRSENDSYRSVADMKKRNKKLKVLLTVYGATKAKEYSTIAADPVKRTTFVASVTSFLEAYDYDGVNIYWDTPIAEDKKNYITLMKEIKESFAQHGWLLTTTVYYTPIYLGYDPRQLDSIVDWINVACYGFYTEWSKYTGQNAALHPSSEETDDFEQNNFNLVGCAFNWLSYGISENKLSIAISFFGVHFTLKDTNNHDLHSPVIGSTDPKDAGRISYSEICQKYSNWTRVWDDEQKNPYKYYKNKWVGYDDKESVKLKAAYIKKKKFFGATAYPINGDDIEGKCGPKQILLKYVHAGLGNEVDLEK